jgi:hypothetical protein
VDAPIVDRLVPSLDALVATIARRCCDLAKRQSEISARTNFAWWPKHRTPISSRGRPMTPRSTPAARPTWGSAPSAKAAEVPFIVQFPAAS